LKVDHRRETLGRSGSERTWCSPRSPSGRPVLNSPESILSLDYYRTMLSMEMRTFVIETFSRSHTGG